MSWSIFSYDIILYFSLSIRDKSNLEISMLNCYPDMQSQLSLVVMGIYFQSVTNINVLRMWLLDEMWF